MWSQNAIVVVCITDIIFKSILLKDLSYPNPACQYALTIYEFWLFPHSKNKEERFVVFDHCRRKEVGVAIMNDTKLTERLQISLSVKGAKDLLVITMPGVPSINYIFMSYSELVLFRTISISSKHIWVDYSIINTVPVYDLPALNYSHNPTSISINFEQKRRHHWPLTTNSLSFARCLKSGQFLSNGTGDLPWIDDMPAAVYINWLLGRLMLTSI